MSTLFYCLLTISFINKSGHGREYFSSIIHMEKLLETEYSAINFLKKYINRRSSELETLKHIATEYSYEYENASSNAEQYLSNPVNAYLLLKHLTADWQKIKKLIMKNDEDIELENLMEFERSSSFPNDEDVDGAADALSRLQITYELQTAQLARSFLNAEDFYEIGKRLFNDENYAASVPWMQEAAIRSQKNPSRRIAAMNTKIMDYLAMSFYKQGNISEASSITNDLLNVIPAHRRALENRVNFETKSQYELEQVLEEKLISEIYEDQYLNKIDDISIMEINPTKKYRMLCRDEVPILADIQKDLKCHYVDYNIPFLKLAPFKQEVLHTKPQIILYHDIISDEEIEVMKKLALPKFERSLDGRKHYRLSETSRLWDGQHEVLRTLSKRIRHMTRLDLRSSERYHVLNYGLGGYYLPHRDFTDIGYFGTGDRIATVLFYMSDVEGGATVFTNLNVRVVPKKGTAIFWYNLLPSGEPDIRTYHSGCPVLNGSKWVITKWLHERGQEFLKPCTLDNEYVD